MRTTAESHAPFHHVIIDGFLPDDACAALQRLYRTFTFREIASDLFSFTQTQELNGVPQLEPLTHSLDELIETHVPLKGRWYNIFASYYRKGDYLLCHDDVIENRYFAFCYYLDDFAGGELVLYEADCVTEHSRIAVKKNRLVIFRVGPDSFHEVAKCPADGRMAIIGWFNLPNTRHAKPAQAEALEEPAQEGTHAPRALTTFPLDIALPHGGGAVCVELDDFEAFEDPGAPRRRKSGPYTDRRCTLVEQAEYLAPELPTYELVRCDALEFAEDDYILTNDVINHEFNKAGEYMDVFIFTGGELVPNFLRIIEASGQEALAIEARPGCMYVVNCPGSVFCVPPVAAGCVRMQYISYRRRASPGANP